MFILVYTPVFIVKVVCFCLRLIFVRHQSSDILFSSDLILSCALLFPSDLSDSVSILPLLHVASHPSMHLFQLTVSW